VLQHSRSLTSPSSFNASVEHLQDLCTAIKKQHSGLSVSDVIVLHIGACPHITHTVQDVLCSRQWKVFNHAVYSLISAPFNLHVFHSPQEFTKEL